MFPFASAASPISDTFAISAGQVVKLKNEEYYINIHTAAFPAGEIRGQIVNQAATPPGAPADAPVVMAIAAVLSLIVAAAALRRMRASAA